MMSTSRCISTMPASLNASCSSAGVGSIALRTGASHPSTPWPIPAGIAVLWSAGRASNRQNRLPGPASDDDHHGPVGALTFREPAAEPRGRRVFALTFQLLTVERFFDMTGGPCLSDGVRTAPPGSAPAAAACPGGAGIDAGRGTVQRPQAGLQTTEP